jgi:Tol biopolymer transport system component
VRNLRGKLCLQSWFVVFATIALACCQQTINYPGPRIATVSPTHINAGQPTFTLTATGYNFTPASMVNWNGAALSTLFVNTNTLTAQVSSILIETAAVVSIAVSTPSPGGGVTTPLAFTIDPTSSPLPHITSISPSAVLTGSDGFALNITGTNFVKLSNVLVNGSTQAATFGSSTSLQVSVPASYATNAGSLQVVVMNPPPDGGSSNTFTLSITNPVPSIVSLSPTSGQAGSTSAVLSLTGTGFVADSEIVINGVGRTTSFASSSQLRTQLIASDFVAGGIDHVQVVNPGPGGGTSNTLPFAVNPTGSAGLPVLVDVAPDGSPANNGVCGGINSCQSGSQGLTLTTSRPSVSQTGQFVAFASISNNLVTKQTNSSSEIFYRNTCLTTTSGVCTPATSLLSTATDGGLPNGPSSEPSLDSTGTHASYTSLATNLVNYVNLSSGQFATEVYWQAVCAGTTGNGGVSNCSATSSSTGTAVAPAVLVSLAFDGVNSGNGNSYNPVISADGQYVAFVSLATNLVSNVSVDGVTPQVYIRTICGGAIPTTVHPTCNPTTYLVSSPDGVRPGNGPGSHPAISNNGLYVSFASSATNLGVAAPNPQGLEEIFERSTCSTTIGQTGNTCVPATRLVSTPDASTIPKTPAGGSNSEPAISYDGRFVAFASTATNLGAASAGVQQIYVRDTCTAATSCTPSTRLVSTRDGTTPANALSETPSMNRVATGSGQFIAFASIASNLAANVSNGVESIFVRNTCAVLPSSTTACSSGLALASQPSGTSPPAANGMSVGPAISGDGHTVAFLSFASDLVARDDNALEDIFLASTSF